MPSIVLVEDNPVLLHIWAEQLKQAGHAVQSTTAPEEGLHFLKGDAPDVLLVDSVMPRLDGRALVEAFRQQKPGARTRVVLLVMQPQPAEDMPQMEAEGIHHTWVKTDMSGPRLEARLNAMLRDEEYHPGGAEVHLLDSLVAARYITEEHRQKALAQARQDMCMAAQVLVEMGAVAAELTPYLMELALKTDYLPLSQVRPQRDALARIASADAAHHKVLPLSLRGGRLRIAMADPRDLPTLDLIGRLGKAPIEPVYSPEHEIATAIMVHYGGERAAAALQAKSGTRKPASKAFFNEKSLEQAVTDQPVIELLDSLLVNALEQRASDIHIEPHQDGVIVRFRIDGILHDERQLPYPLAEPVLARIKILGEMDVAERRLPQDGRYQVNLQGRLVDFRISTVPVLNGEKAVLRILDRGTMDMSLESIGFGAEQLALYRRLVERSYGLILVTGPTGSGKTSTLYATLNHLQSTTMNLVSIEDPVEYRIDRVNQIQVNEKIGLTFGEVLRSVLRQDPNVILVGEIRDRETAELAVQAALTGHLVLATLHTNDAPGALIRLVDMGVPDYLVASTVTAVLAQRLVRRVCQKCAQPHEPTVEELEQLHAQGGVHLKQGRGCDACRGTGYRGRVAVFELLELTETLRRAFLQHPQSIYRLVREEGMPTMRDNALARVRDGMTTLLEVNRVSVAEHAARVVTPA